MTLFKRGRWPLTALLAVATTAQAQSVGAPPLPVPVVPGAYSYANTGVENEEDIPLIEPDSAVASPGGKTSNSSRLRGTVFDEDYRRALEANFPLTPEQIEDMGRTEDAIDRAVASRVPPSVATMTFNVTTRPGVAPARILLSDDYVTTLSFLDNTGAAWPVSRAMAGNSEMFEVDVPENPGNIVILAPKRKYASSNLMVLLRDSSVPVMLSLVNNRSATYYNANLVLDQAGPHATSEVVRPPTDPVDDSFMRAILDGAGAVTAGIKQVRIEGDALTTAFVAANKFYIRTPHLLIFPNNNTASMRSGGIRVYELPISPLITVADENGRPLDLQPSEEVLIDGALASHASQREHDWVGR